MIASATTTVILASLFVAGVAHADNPKRKVAVLEFRAGSDAMVGIGTQMATEMSRQTSLGVMSPQQAKTAFGDGLDQAVVKCGGEASCVAKIGAKLGVAEVLLIGISELGDVILTIQRIDVAGGSVTARVADSLAPDAKPSGEEVGYYLGKVLPPGDFMRFGVIAITSNQPGALVTVGKEQKGTTPIEPLKLRAPATYTIKVEKTGFDAFSTKIQLPPDSELTVEANLSRKSSKAWYQRWYVVVGLGAVVAVAAGTTIYFASGGGDDRLEFMGSVE